MLRPSHPQADDLGLALVVQVVDFYRPTEPAKAAGAAEVLQKPITEEWRSVITLVRNRPH